MKKLLLISLALAGFASLSFGEIKIITPQLTFYPARDIGRVARIVFETTEKGTYFILIKDGKGQLVRCLATGPKEAGRVTVDWDGKDSSGTLVPVGTYKASLSQGLKWELDKSFGKDGRIGKFALEQTVDDPEKMQLPLPGELISVKVNDAEYYKTDDLSVAGPNFLVKDGVLRISPLGGAKKGDKLKVDYYYPTSLTGFWDLQIDEAGNLYILLRYLTESHFDPLAYYEENLYTRIINSAADKKILQGTLVKLNSDGKEVDKGFADSGRVPPFLGSQQVLLSPREKRIYIAGSVYDGYGTGVYSMNSGAYFYYIGTSGSGPSSTFFPSGICLGKGDKIYLLCCGSGIVVYDRTKELDKGFLYHTARPVARYPLYPAFAGLNWGPSMEPAQEEDSFYVSTSNSEISKIKDDGKSLSELYFVAVKGTPYMGGSPLGMSLDRSASLLYVALRTVAGEVAVFADDGQSLNEVARLKDAELGPVHTVRYHNGYLYVLEDGLAFGNDWDLLMQKSNMSSQGRDRLSRYRVAFDKETDVATLERK